MIEYTVSSFIKFADTHKVKLTQELCYKNPQGFEVAIQSANNNDFSIRMGIEAENQNQLTSIVEAELNRIANILCWNHRTQIIDSGISSISYKETDNKENIIGLEIIKLVDSVSVTENLRDEEIRYLADKLEKNYNNEFEEILFMWREMIDEKTNGLRFFLLYRILEWIYDKRRIKVDAWIKNQEPDVEIRLDNKGKEVTIYTFLRDNVHAKTTNFPYEDIDKYIAKFEQLVKAAVNEKFNL